MRLGNYRSIQLVTATDDIGVSYTSGSGIEGVLLTVTRRPGDRPYSEPPDYLVNKMPFPDCESADAYALEHGWLKVYVPRLC